MSRPIAIDLYAGAGGLSLGLEQAGFDVVLAIDRDPYHVATHQRNFPHGKVQCASVDSLTGSELIALAGTKDIGLICGGPPCQGFSTMGKRYVADPRNTLVDHFARLVMEVMPAAFLMENVPGMQSGATAVVFERTIDRLSNHYNITAPVRTLNAADFGVPQRRERLFVIGILKERGGEAVYPTGPCKEQPARPTVWQAIEDLPALGEREDLLKLDTSEYRKVGHDLHPYVLAARGLRADPCDLSWRRDWDNSKVTGCRRVKHRPEIERLYAATAPGATVPAHNLPRLDPDGLAPTLRAGTDSEHGSYNAPRPIHPYEPRCITVREAARLHGYPDWFDFYPVKWHAHRQIGNSVCPPIARALGGSIIRALDAEVLRPSKVLKLTNEFSLPPDAAKHHGRIPQVDEWPKVLDRLLEKAGVIGRGRVRRPAFSVDDVRQAYKDTDAKMPRTPPDRFLQDIARSRNRRWIMSGVLAEGLSIVPVNENGTYGRFVRKGTVGTLEARDFITVSSEEITLATRVPAIGHGRISDDALADYLSRKKVSDALFRVGQVTISRIESNGAATRTHAVGTFVLKKGERRLRSGIIVRGIGQELPPLTAVTAILDRMKANAAVVMSAITQRHFVAVLVTRRSDRVLERRRGVFEVGAAPYSDKPGVHPTIGDQPATRGGRSRSN
ncbi:MAG: DNA cytosine methyltransferase [Vicinamibacterales bacterium]